MADIFIVYDSADSHIANTVAAWLRAQGWNVLNSPAQKEHVGLPRDEVLAAQSVLVIWTRASVRAEQVVSEARIAGSEKKLMQLKMPDVEISDIPPFFRDQPIMDASQFSFIADALHEQDREIVELPLPVMLTKRKRFSRLSDGYQSPTANPGFFGRASDTEQDALGPIARRGEDVITAGRPLEPEPKEERIGPPEGLVPSMSVEELRRLEEEERVWRRETLAPSAPVGAPRSETWEPAPQAPRRLGKWLLAASASFAATFAASLAAVVVYRKGLAESFSSVLDGVGKLLALLNLNAMPPPIATQDRQDAQTDIVDCSVFAPPSAPAGKSIFVQVFLHASGQMDRAETIATKIDPGSRLRSIATLQTEVVRGQRGAITLDCPELATAEVSREIVWWGHPQAVSFRLTIPRGTRHGTEFFPVVRVSIDGAPVGFLEFSLSCQDTPIKDTDATGKEARRYKYAFLSYASQDRREVIKFARALNAARIGFFQDILSLEPGEEWEPRLFEEIDKCDVLYLFWSKHAAASQMVQREAEYAYNRASRAGRKIPDITPIRLDASPLPTSPPHAQWMTKIHFDDYFRKMIED